MGTRRTSLTDQQRAALDRRAVSIALSAGAGCGKTFVLTQRFLAQLEPADGEAASRLGEVVAITFTERAAREMRDRIRRACLERLLDAPAEREAYWLALVREMDSARISTIHSFCGTTLRAHAVQAGLDPRFRVLDEAEAATLLDQALEQELGELLAAEDPAAMALAEELGLNQTREAVAELLGSRESIEWDAWLAMEPEALARHWEDYLRRQFLPRHLAALVGSAAAATVLRIAGAHRPSNATMQARLAFLEQNLPRLAESTDPEAELESIREHAKVQGGGGKKAWDDELAYAEFRDASTQLRAEVDKLKQTAALRAETMLDAARLSLHLLRLAHRAVEAYGRRKAELGCLDFSDLITRTRALLGGPEGAANTRSAAARAIGQGISLLLVDEFQDVDPVQAELVTALCRDRMADGRLFLVGDYKQSIYRFRGADPEVFRRLRHALPETGRLPLSLNFRSQPAVIEAVNAIFCEAMGEEYEPLSAHRPRVEPEARVEMLWACDEQFEPERRPTERLRRLEADWIARRIAQMLQGDQHLVVDAEAEKRGEPKPRRVRPGDVAILFRALSDVAYYEEALRRYGIDYYLVGGHAFYAQQEIFDVLNLLRAVAMPSDTASLAGVLRSGMFNLADETLFWLSQRQGGLAAGLGAEPLPKEIPPPQRERVAAARRVLAGLRELKDRVPIARLIQQALDWTGYDAVVVAEFLGQRKLANLRKLIDQAREFDATPGAFTLEDFVGRLAEFVARQPKEPLAATQPELTDLVRLMTIHQSKGLEFPVVFVADLDRPSQGGRDRAAYSPALGPMVAGSSGAGGLDLYRRDERLEDEAESLRMFYVATTRAADYLVLSAGLDSLDTVRSSWMELLKQRFDLSTGMLKGRLPEGYAQPSIRATTDRPEPKQKPRRSGSKADPEQVAQAAEEAAAAGRGTIPRGLRAVEPDPTAATEYSFSRLSGLLHWRGGQEAQASEVTTHDETPPWGTIDPRGFGTLVHAALAELDFAAPGDIPALVRKHAAAHLAEDDAQIEEAVDMIRRFASSTRARAIAAAPKVLPEVEFLLRWPTDAAAGSEASPVAESGGRLLRGFIDCLYQDAGGGWHLVDYKTNRANQATLAAVAAPYELQMLLYARAAETILGQSPGELVLCFLRPGLEYRFDWNAEAKQKVARLMAGGLKELSGNN